MLVRANYLATKRSSMCLELQYIELRFFSLDTLGSIKMSGGGNSWFGPASVGFGCG